MNSFRDKDVLECRTEVDLYYLAIRRGYKHPEYWARKKWEGRQKRESRLKALPPKTYRNYYETTEERTDENIK